MRKRISTIIFVIIFLIGLSILLYPAVSEYVNERHSSRAIASYDKLVEELPEADYSKELQDAQAYNEYLAQFGNLSEAASTEKEREDSPYEDLLNTGGSGIMSIINIPGIAVELPVYHGTSEGVLQVAAGHYEGSSLPIGGESTHAIITGHRGLPSAKLFTDLDRLETGDVFYLKTLGEILEYQIDQIVTVLPSEVDGLSIEPGKDYVTLVTCTPYGINSHRLLIRGTRIPYDGKYAEKVPLKPAPAVSDRPAEEQECGAKEEVRWAKVTDRKGRGMLFEMDENNDPMMFSALPYTPHEMENAMHPYELPEVHYTVVRVAKDQMGIGGDDSWGARTHEEYLLKTDKKMEFSFVFKGL